MVVGILLAAGAAQRFGRDKLRESWRGQPLLAHALAALLEARTLGEVIVVVPPGGALPFATPRARIAENAAHAEGLGASLRAGVAAAPAGAAAFAIALGDLPALRAGTIDALVNAWRARGGIVVPEHAGRRGHPVVFAARYRAALLACSGDTGARAVLAAHAADVHELAVDDPGIWRDVDVPADIGALEQEPR